MEEKKGVPKFNIDTDFVSFYQDSRGAYMVNRPEPAEIPKIFVVAETHPAAYELASIALWDHGTRIRTHYDKKEGLLKKEGFIDYSNVKLTHAPPKRKSVAKTAQ